MNEKKPSKQQVMPMEAQSAGDKNKSGLTREIQSKIGQQLRAMYDGVVQEGVPDRFAELLRQLDKPSDEGKSG